MVETVGGGLFSPWLDDDVGVFSVEGYCTFWINIELKTVMLKLLYLNLKAKADYGINEEMKSRALQSA